MGHIITKALLFTFLLCSVISFAQNYKQTLKNADILFNLGEYYGANKFYKKALEFDPNDMYSKHQSANCYRLTNDYKKAAEVYLQIYKKDRGRTYPMDVYWYSVMLKYNGEYNNAKKYFKKCVRYFKKQKEGFEYQKVIHEQKSCEEAIIILRDSADEKIQHLSLDVNSYESDFAGYVKIEKEMYFSSLRTDKANEDNQILDTTTYFIKLFEAKGDSIENWKTVGEMPEKFNLNGYHNANGSWSSDGLRFYFTRCDKKGQCKIMVASKGEEPKEIEEINHEKYTSTQPYEAKINDKFYLFFVSDREGGKGKLDIWYSPIDQFWRYGKPVNLGDSVNSIDNEISPCYDSDDSTLYFSSEWYMNLGGFDIFRSKGTPKSGFYAPVNMKPPFNSSLNDMYFSKTGRIGIFTSNRDGSFAKKGENCCNDLYVATLPEKIIKKSIVEIKRDELRKYLPTLYFHNDEPNPRTRDTITQKNYMTTYTDYVKLKKEYKNKYAEGLEGDDKLDAEDDIDAFFENYAERGVKDLEIFTKLLLEELKKGTQIELTIKGYASPLSKSDYNVNLTLRRISSLINYLQQYEKGIFNPFFDSKQLTIIKIPFGEYKSEKNVSDNYYDTKNSIYNPKAALERKIEILAIEFNDSTNKSFDGNKLEKLPVIKFEQTEHHFNEINSATQGVHEFKVTNTGEIDLFIYSATSSCYCTQVEFDKNPIKPGETTNIKAILNNDYPQGKFGASIEIITNAKPNRYTIFIDGTKKF